MRYGTVCSGVEAVSLAWEGLGFSPAFFSEIAEFPCAVLAHHFPDVPNLGNLLGIRGEDWRGKLDVLWGSTPCQAFSAAGRRESLSDARGALTLGFCELANEIDPPLICWENVKGALSAKGNAFGCLLGALAGEDGPLDPSGGRWTHAGYVLGPKRVVAWRLLDAKYFGVAQQRERLFVIASPRGGADPRDILFEQGSRYQTSPIFATKTRDRGTINIAEVVARSSREENRLFLKGFSPVAHGVAFRGRKGGEQAEIGTDKAFCLRASQGGSDKAFALIDNGLHASVRRLTVLECERLMGFPDGFTGVPFKGRTASDSVRYTAIGNSLAVPVVRWLGERILAHSPV